MPLPPPPWTPGDGLAKRNFTANSNLRCTPSAGEIPQSGARCKFQQTTGTSKVGDEEVSEPTAGLWALSCHVSGAMITFSSVPL